jgi:DNA-binding response OmpR family regulator
MSRQSRSALIVSDSAPLRQYIASTLGAIGIGCTQAANGFHAMDRLAERRFDLYVIDLDMPASDGLTIFAISLMGGTRDPSPMVIGLSAAGESARRASGWTDRSALFAELPKPFHPDELIATAKAALHQDSDRGPR